MLTKKMYSDHVTHNGGLFESYKTFDTVSDVGTIGELLAFAEFGDHRTVQLTSKVKSMICIRDSKMDF